MNHKTVNFDIPSAILRSIVGFESVLSNISNHVDNYPPHNIEMLGNDEYKISLAVAGFSRDELSVSLKEGSLIVSGAKAKNEEEQDGSALSSNYKSQQREKASPTYIHHGISLKPFKRVFKLAEYVEVKSVHSENGLLIVNLVRNVPEDRKEKTFDIG